MGSPNTADCFKILIATDIHLGYNEKDAVRGEDSFIAFEEILGHAKMNEVDFILLGGDLFHDPNPTQNAMHKCMKLLRDYTMGDKPIEIEFLSDQSVNFQDTGNTTVNYEDPNMNIAYPVFSIHGNHDDPCGLGRLSSLDLLATSGLVNYFGRNNDSDGVDIQPILMRKGKSQLALYGLSHIHDNRLVRLFRDSKVVMHQPDERSGEWFSVMVLHQNRADRGNLQFVPEDALPDFVDLVVWGHEHDCRIIPEENAVKNFFVTQPGSSVATSLSEGESIDKHIGLLSVCENQFKLETIKLKTVRPFVFKSVILDDYAEELELEDIDPVPKVKAFLKRTVEEMLKAAAEKVNEDCPQQPKLPLIRLQVKYTDETLIDFNAIRFGQQYGGKEPRVANHMDMFKFNQTKKSVKRGRHSIDKDAMHKAFQKKNTDEDDEDIRLEDYVNRYFANAENSAQLQILPSNVMSEMCRRLAEHNDDDAVQMILDFVKKKACEYLNEKMPDEDDIEEALEGFRAKSDETYGDVLRLVGQRTSTNSTVATTSSSRVDNEIDNAEKENNFASVASNGRHSASAAPAASARGGRKAAKVVESPKKKTTPAPKTSARAKTSLNLSNARAKQPTINDAFAQPQNIRGTRGRPVTYTIEDSDSD